MYYLTLFLVLGTLFIYNEANVIVNTEQGRLRGEYLQTVTGDMQYASFKGIPYAAPPLGDLRFQAPQDPEPWEGVRNATSHGANCVQINIYTGVDISGEEDCLFLNVYTPKVKPKRLLPVMFYIHGGGYQSGSGDSDRYGPDYLITKNVVLVTINYRLGALGFLSVNTPDVPGNAGMKDQVAALRWVNRNIANFGGNPDEVTIFGQSTGSASVGFHNLSPMTKGLYKRGIQMSGSPYCDWAVPIEPVRIAFRLGQQLGYWTRDVDELIEFLRSVPAVSLLGTNPAVLRAEDPKITLRQLTYVPVVETDFGAERYLTRNPIETMKCGNMHNVDLMIGRTAIEGLIKFIFGGDSVPEQYTNYTEMLLPRVVLENIAPVEMFRLADMVQEQYFGDRQVNNDTAREFIQYLSDISFAYGTTSYGRRFSKHRNTFMYRFSRKPQFPRYTGLLNEFGTNEAMHEDDLMYVFNPGNKTVDVNSEDFKVIKTTSTLYANFAKYGNPTPNNALGVKWPKYNELTGNYLNIDTKLTVRKHLDGVALKFWDSIYRYIGIEF